MDETRSSKKSPSTLLCAFCCCCCCFVLIPLVSTLTSIGLDECPTDVVLPDGGQIFPAHVVLKTRPYQFLTTGLFWTTTDIYEDETSSRKKLGFWRDYQRLVFWRKWVYTNDNEDALIHASPEAQLFGSRYRVHHCGSSNYWTVVENYWGVPFFQFGSQQRLFNVYNETGHHVADCMHQTSSIFDGLPRWTGIITSAVDKGVEIGRIQQVHIGKNFIIQFTDTEWSVQHYRPELLPDSVVGFLGAMFQLAGAETNGGASGGGGSFVSGTLVATKQGEWRRIEQIQIGDELAMGGRVKARMEFEAERSELFVYHGKAFIGNKTPTDTNLLTGGNIIACGGHAVFEPGNPGRWVRVRDATAAIPLGVQLWETLVASGQDRIRVYDLDVEKHRILVRAPDGQGGQVLFSDFSEVDPDHPTVTRFEKELLASLEHPRASNLDFEL